MKRSNAGIGLIELMVAMVLGLVVVLGVTQTFLSAKNTFQSQNSAAIMQEDARYVLSRMMQEIRMTGMFGCLATITDSSTGGAFGVAAATPVSYASSGTTGKVLTLITADIGNNSASPDWTIVTDCATSATAYTGAYAATTAMMKYPVRRVTYTFQNGELSTGIGTGRQVLIRNVADFSLVFGVSTGGANVSDTSITSYTATPTSAMVIRSIRLSLTLTDSKIPKRVRDQTYNVVATIRNRAS